MLRLVELDDADQYFLDCANEYEELDSTSHLALRLFGDRDEIHAIIDPQPIPITSEAVMNWFRSPCHNGWRDRQRRCEALEKMADRILVKIDPFDAGGLIWVGVRQMPHQLKSDAEMFSYMAYDDATTGGSMLPWHYAGIDGRGYPTKRVARRLHAPGFIRKYVRDQRETGALRKRIDRLRARCQLVPNEFIRDTTSAIEEQLKRQHKAEEERRWEAIRFEMGETGPAHSPMVRLKKSALVRLRERRKVLRRAASTAVAVMGREKVSALVHGEQIEFVGREVKFLVKSSGSLAARGHGNLAVSVVGRDDTLLGHLCVYFDETPALDQATALSMFVDGGEESEIIKTANLTFVTEAGREHPLLADRYKSIPIPDDQPQPPQPRDAHIVVDADTGRRVRNHQLQVDLQKEYWSRTKPIWIDAVCSQVFPNRSLAKPAIEIIMAGITA
jgi:hypothetical protein